MSLKTFRLQRTITRNWVNRWDPPGIASGTVPKAIVQISHGMNEHSGRYRAFAEFLNRHNIVVVADDHLGHGRTVFFDKDRHHLPKGGWNRIVTDMEILTETIQREYPHCPVFLFGHSMGAFLAETYAVRYGKRLKGVILSGSNKVPSYLIRLGMTAVKLGIALKDRAQAANWVQACVFRNVNRRWSPKRTLYDWLTRDTHAVDDFMNDPMCDGQNTYGFFENLFNGISQLKNHEEKWPVELPVLLVSGEEDPIGQYGKGVRTLKENYEKAGVKVTCYLYPGNRHECLNELNRETVQDDILRWIEAHL